ncbi:MAG TPA: hypothetical protein VMX13_11605 [Sedimentisphaerales bacterium]|nr:hypothetical protein [Sedimentisphaerales bacterium]
MADNSGREQGKTVHGEQVWGAMWVVAQEHGRYCVCRQTIAGKGRSVTGR